MDDNEYRRICAQPDVMRRSDVRATVARLRGVRPDLADRAAHLLGTVPVPKPAAHAGGSETDYLWLDLDPADIQEIVSELFDLETQQALDDAPALQLGATASLLDRWNAAESTRPAV